MLFGMPTLIENRTLEENVSLCVSLGLRFIELNMNFPEYGPDRLAQTDNLLRIGEDAGIFFTIHLDENLNVADFNRLVSQAYLETVRLTIESAKTLACLQERFGGGRPMILNMHMNHGVHITLPDRKVQMYERDNGVYMESFAAFRSLCEEWIGSSGMMIAIENTDGFRDHEKRAVEYLLKSEKFGLTWDIGHSKACREKDEPFLLAHRERLIHFHIHDGMESPPRDHLTLGDGEIDLAERLRLAESLGAGCVLETKTAEALNRSVAWLRENGLWQ